jgi:hypothetical protein
LGRLGEPPVVDGEDTGGVVVPGHAGFIVDLAVKGEMAGFRADPAAGSKKAVRTCAPLIVEPPRTVHFHLTAVGGPVEEDCTFPTFDAE